MTEPLALTAAPPSVARPVSGWCRCLPCFGPAATAARVTRFDVGQGYPGACVA